MVLPLGLLHSAEGHPMLVELKNGETYNGHLVNCDNFMNLTLREVIQTSPEGDRFWSVPECFIKGATIKYLRVPDEILDIAKQNVAKKRQNRENNRNQNSNRGQQRGRGRGGGQQRQ